MCTYILYVCILVKCQISRSSSVLFEPILFFILKVIAAVARTIPFGNIFDSFSKTKVFCECEVFMLC